MFVQTVRILLSDSYKPSIAMKRPTRRDFKKRSRSSFIDVKADTKSAELSGRSRKKTSKSSSTRKVESTTTSTPPASTEAKWEFDEKDAATISKSVASFLNRLKKNGAFKSIRDEFIRARSYIPEGSKQAFTANESRNRYRDVLLLDKTRVILKNRENDYIHASKVMVGNNMFICTQGPLEGTVQSFWAMVFQEKAKLIVMLCKFIEEGREKCCEYFPKTEGKLVFGDFVVECTSRVTIPNADGATCGTLQVTNRGRKEMIEHIWYENWMDHAIPENFKASMELIQLARTKRNNSPVVVHCSAGVGRTGCFVAVELAAHKAATEANFTMDSVLKEIRDQRMHSVQNEVQYLYIHRGLIEYLINKGVTRRLDVLKFIKDYDNLAKKKKIKETAEKDLLPKSAKSKDYCPSVYYNPYNFYF